MKVPWRKRISRTIRGHLRSRVLSGHGIGVLAATRNGLLIVDPRDFGVSRSLLAHGSYDWEQICWLGRLLDENSRIVFVGAHVGALLIPLVLRSDSRHIVAFEPSPRNHRLLRMNLALNSLTRVVVHHQAIGSTSGTALFIENEINSGNDRISDSGDVMVAVSTLDTAMSRHWSDIDLLVMDTEGFEAHAIRGASRTLARTRHFYVEYAPAQLLEQGSSAQEFIELVATHFSSMYLPGEPVRFFGERSFVQYLRDVSTQHNVLLNLMFSNDTSPDPRMVTEM